MATLSSRADSVSRPETSLQEQGAFRNHAPVRRAGLGKTLGIFWRMLFHKPRNTRPVGAIPVQPLTHEQRWRRRTRASTAWGIRRCC